jgi:two-component system response regulator FixJ
LPSLVHIVDDDALIRASTSFLLASHGYATEVYASGAEFLREARLTRGCVLLDLRMPEMSGHQVQAEMVRRGVDLPVVIMSGHGDVDAAVEAMKLGAVDYLSKPAREEALFAAVERALTHHREAESRRAAAAAAAMRLQRLSPRESQILQGLLAGLSNKEIARRLGLSPRTVEMHRANMMDDLGITNLAEALRLGIDAGLPPLDATQAEAPPVPVRAAAVAKLTQEVALKGEALRLVLEASADGAWEWVIPTNEIKISPGIVERLGYDRAEAAGNFSKLQDYMHPDDWETLVEEVGAHLAGRTEGFAAEIRMRRRDGSWAWLFDCGSIVERDEDGQPLKMVGSLSDITRRKEEQQRAREAAELLELAQWGAGAGVWELEIETRRLRLSARSRALHGLPHDSPEWMDEAAWMETVHPDDRLATAAAISAAARTGEPWMIEYRNAAGRTLLSLGKVVRDVDGQPRRMLGLGQAVESGRALRLGAAIPERERMRA